MGIKMQFDVAGNPIEPTLILANHSGNRLGLLTDVSDINLNEAFVEAPELTFTATKKRNFDSIVVSPTNLWDYILDIKLVHCLEWDTWFQIQVELSDSDSTVKSVTGTGLCQAELSQTLLHGLEFNTEADIERDDYERSTIYNFVNPNASVLHAIFEKIPHYTLKHVDASIASIQKTFTFDGISIEDAFNQIAEECHCIFVYNNGTNPDTNMPAREVSVYDMETICLDCGHRGEYSDVCPECGSTNLKTGYGNDTRIFVSKDNLTNKVVFSTDLPSVKNCFKMVAGDDIMTSAIQACNPNGTDYIWCISDDIKADMPHDMVVKIEEYDKLYDYYSKEHITSLDASLVAEYNTLIEKYKPYNDSLLTIDDLDLVGYSSLMNIIYDVIDFNAFLQSGLMPLDDDVNDTSAEKEAAKLTSESLTPIAINSTNDFSETVINQMVLAVARIIVDKRYDVQIKESKIIYEENADDENKHQWVGKFTVTNYADDDMTADTGDILIFINNDYEKYIRQRVEKILTDTETEDYDISNLLEIDKPLDEFVESIKPYNISILINLKDACDTCLDTLQSESIGNQTLWKDLEDGVDMYDKYYLNYYNKLEALLDEILVKEKEQKVIQELQQFITNERSEIQQILNFENYLGEDMWKIFCSYKREDIYKNENYISDNLTNAEIFANAREFYEVAQKEIYKSANLQHSITATLKNLLVIPEFKPLVDSFEVGNWLRIEVDGEIYKLRLIKYSVDFSDLTEVSVEFSDVMKTADGITDIQSVIDKTNSIASSYDTIKRQANKGDEASITVNDWFNNGMSATHAKIMDDSSTQDVVLDKHGILIREYDDITESYYPTQMKFINSILALTTDNWKTIKTAIGNFIYQDPVTLEYKNAYGINAETLVGSLILGQTLGIYNEKASMRFDENGLWIYNDVNSFRVNPNDDILLSLSKNDEKMLWVDEDGMLHICGDGAGLDIQANSSVTNLQTSLQVTADGINAKIDGVNSSLSNQIEATASELDVKLSNATTGLQSEFNQRADEIELKVEDYKSGLETSISQTETDIRAELSNTKAGLENTITATANSLTTDIRNVESGMNSLVQQTEQKIMATVTDEDEKLQVNITTTAAEIRSEMQDVYDGLDSKITQTAETITSQANDKYEDLHSQIQQNASDIDMMVTAHDDFVSEYNQTYNQITMTIQNLEMDWNTKFEQTDTYIQTNVTEIKDEQREIWSDVNQNSESIKTLIKNTEDMEFDLTNQILSTATSTESKIHSIIVNARNLAYGTGDLWDNATVTDAENIQTVSAKIHIKNKGIKVDNTILVHFDAKFSEDFAETETGISNMYIAINKNPLGSIPEYVPINNQSYELKSILNSETREGKISFSFTVTDDMLDETYSEYMELFIRFDYYTGIFYWKCLMVECGTTENAWINAPEDIDVDFYDVQTELKDAQTSIKQTNDTITLQAERINEHESQIALNADKIAFVVKDSEDSSSFEITDQAITAISEKITFKGMVTIENLSDDVTAKIEAGVVSMKPLYILSGSSSSCASKDSASWSETVNWYTVKNSSNNFVWQLIETTYGDGTTSRTDPVCLSDGKEIERVQTLYYLHTSSTTSPTSSPSTWQSTMPNYESGKYIWTSNYIIYTDGSTKYTTPVYDSGLTVTNESVSTVLGTDLHTVYCQKDEPIAPHVVGDVWYQLGTDEGASKKDGIIAMKIWTSDGKWELQQLGSTTILNGTIVTDLLAANAVTTQKLATNAIRSLWYEAGKCPNCGANIEENNYSSYCSCGSIVLDKRSEKGTFFDLGNGALYSKYFYFDESAGMIAGWTITKTAIFCKNGNTETRLQSTVDSNTTGSALSVYKDSDYSNPMFYVNADDGHTHIGYFLLVKDRISCESYISAKDRIVSTDSYISAKTYVHTDGYLYAEGDVYEQGKLLSSRYAQLSHNHDGVYSASGHNHDGRYSLSGHNHSGVYAPYTHSHSDYLSTSGGTLTGSLTVNSTDIYLGGTNHTNSKNISVENSKHKGSIYLVGGSGNFGLYDWTNNKWLIYSDTSGTITSNASDKRLKNDHGIISRDISLTILRGIKEHEFTYKSDSNKIIQYGIMAQDLRDILIKNNIGYRSIIQINDNSGNDGVTYYDLTIPEENVTYGIDYSKFVPLLHDGWQYHDEKIESLEARIAELEAKIASLTA